MPKNLTGNPASFPTQTAPLATEPRTAGGLEAALQNAADRAEHLNDRLTFVDPDKTGVRRQRRFLSVAAMKASVDMPDKSVALIDGVGFYQYDAASVLTEASPAVIAPTSVGAGAGRWLALWLGSFNVANGIPQLDATGKVPTSLLAASAAGKIQQTAIKNGLVDLQYAALPATNITTTSSTSFVDVATPQLVVNAQSGDVLKVTATFQLDNATGNAEALAIVARPTLGTVRVADMTFTAGSAGAKLVVVGAVAINENGAHTVKLQHRVSSIGSSNVVGPSLIAELYRP